MSKLSFYQGFTQLSFARDGVMLSFPHSYNQRLFSNSFNQARFYSELFELVSDELEVPLATCDIFVIGVADFPELPYNIKQHVSLLDVLPENYLFVSSDLLATNSGFSSAVDLEAVESSEDFFGNLLIYPGAVHKDRHDIMLKDKIVMSLLKSLPQEFSESVPIVITGDRMTQFTYNNLLTYILAIDLIRSEGVFEIKLDVKNLFPHFVFSTLQSMLTIPLAPKTDHFDASSTQEYLSFGTLVNSPGKTECLYKPEYGNSQFVTVAAEDLFVFPLDAGSKGEIFVKNAKGKLEKTVYGGELGIVIDTRNKSGVFETSNLHMDFINQYLHKLME